MVEKVLKEAKRRLKKDPFDVGHDYDHHLAVVMNCLTIIENENLDLDVNSLLIAAWWHDYKRNQDDENDRILTETMIQAGFEQSAIKKVLSIKNAHSFGNEQISLEQQVLFDADKLEYASVERIKKVSAAVVLGEMTEETQGKYKAAFKDRIAKVLKNLHFESTRNRMKTRIEEVRAYCITDPKWTGIVDEI